MQAYTETDHYYMGRALALARKGKGSVHPNPLVGCVIVRNGRIVGEGYHAYFGGPHAEAVALENAGTAARGATLYVNLEPCDHWGKTPPCTRAIISAGIRTVVAATADPNPRTCGRGFATLASHGIAVVTDIRKSEADRLNSAYIRASTRTNRLITAKAAMSLDGKIATGTQDSKWITGPRARAFGHRLRAGHDAVIVGITTVLSDNPELTAHGTGKNPVRVIIDPDLRIPLNARVVTGRAAPTVIIHTKNRQSVLRKLKEKHVIPIHVPVRGRRIPFRAITDALAGIGLRTLLVEGGGNTLAAAFESGLVDNICFFYAPVLIGGAGAVTSFEGAGMAKVAQALRVKNLKVRTVGADILVTGTLRNK